MLALTLAQSVAALANLAVIALVVLLVLAVVASTTGGLLNPEQRIIRERRRHAERTARAMRRMSDIRRQTLARMDQVEERWRP